MKRLVGCLLCLVLLTALSACGQENAVTGDADKGVFIVNQYRYGDSADIPLPEGAQREDNGYLNAPLYRFGDRDALDAYSIAAEQQGFTAEKLPYFTLFYREGCYLFLSHQGDDDYEGDAYGYLTVYCGAETPAGGLSAEQAREIIAPDSRLLPIDVTPEELFENTGGQIFMLPVYSLDRYRELYGKDAGDGLESPENQYYSDQYYCVAGGGAIRLDQPDLAFLDIDGDGVRETVRMGFGPTSGVYTFTVTAFRGAEQIASAVFAPSDYADYSFEEVGGRLHLKSAVHSYEVSLDGDTVALTENGEPFNEWGSSIKQNP